MINNTIPKGYKQSKVGVIPEDWDVVKLGDVGEILTGSTPPTNDRSNYGVDYLFVSPTDLGKSKWILKSEKRLSKKGFDISRKFPPKSILFTCIGSTIGKSGIASKYLTSNQQINAILPTDKFDSEHIYYSLQIISNKIKAQAGEQAVPMINKSEFAKFQIPLPPTFSEQQKIAKILATWDSAIEQQQTLINQKQQLKKGLMQQLLTGKTRFTGFTDDWEEVKIKQIFDTTRGYVLAVTEMKKEKTEEYQYPVYSSQTKNNGLTGYYSEYLFEDCVTWTTDGANAGDVNLRKGKFYGTNVCGVLKNNNGYANQCIAEILNSVTKNHVSYVGNPKLMNNVMDNIKILIPKSIKEQEKIAKVLSNADKEIELLKNELNELKQQKKALMQKLLTGQVRVKL